MTRFEQKTTPAIYVAMLLSMAAVFASDFYTRLGVAVWVAYLVPAVLSLFVWRPVVPLAVAAAATILIVIGRLVSPPAIDSGLALLNRGFGVLTVWVVAGICYQFIRGKLAVRKQQWLQSGQTRLSERMFGEQRVSELGENCLRFLCEYVDAQAGAIFIEDGSGFRRFATYATPAGSVPERFAAGEGLLGQAVKDKRVFVVRDVPDGYLSIGSGFGQGRPRHLIIAPATVDGSVNAVVELGFFHPIYDTDTEFFSRVAPSIGVAVRSAKYRARLQEDPRTRALPRSSSRSSGGLSPCANGAAHGRGPGAFRRAQGRR